MVDSALDTVNDLPDFVILNDPAISYRVWRALRATDWRWTINQILAQPEAIMDDVIVLESLYSRIMGQALKKEEMPDGD